jgi:NAD(P)-dependent dehydrogenase (short-subunit alcohol dehydrogenase family)
MVDKILAKYKKIDILHNNVGGWQREMKDTVVDNTEQEWDRLINLNLRGTFLVSKLVIPHMIKTGGGSIINTVTTNAYMNYQRSEAYGTAKGGTYESNVPRLREVQHQSEWISSGRNAYSAMGGNN